MQQRNCPPEEAEAMKSSQADNSVGFCLNCGEQLTRCGRPFTDTVLCRPCGAMNVYVDSQQPIRVLQQVSK